MRSRMKKAGVVVLAMAALGGLGIWKQWVFPKGVGPKLALSRAVVDLGTIEAEGKATGEVRVTNGGSGELRIGQVVRDCGCTEAVVSRNVLKPGEWASVRITLDGAGFARDVRKKILLESNDPASPLTTVMVSAYVKVGVRIDKTQLFLGMARQHESLSELLHVVRDRGAKVGEIRVTDLAEEMTATVGAWKKSGELEVCPIEVSIKSVAGGVGLHRHRAMVIVGEQQRFPVEVQYEILPMVQHEPRMLVVRVSEEGRGAGVLKLKWVGDAPEFGRITSMEGRFEGSFVRQEAGGCEVQVVGSDRKPPRAGDFDVLRIAYRAGREGTEEMVMVPIRCQGTETADR